LISNLTQHCMLRRYRLVGETIVQALWIGHSYFALYPRDRIAVRRGDIIGIYFPRYRDLRGHVASSVT